MTHKDMNKGSLFSEEERDLHINEEQIYLQQYHAGDPRPLRTFWDLKRAEFQRRSELRAEIRISVQGKQGTDFGTQEN